ncbi:MAG TPA: RNA-binding cell elongation regulator Jag/EloR [Candidatus Binatia bacterium]|jgi:spoIIIJ-associated protein|nr:RNA-binding cell elongation regulator Jag/EloR [Candidatus Binatia bacterium]
MDHVETEGDTIDKAIDNALRLLGVERDKITVDILSEGKKGILGFGSQKARILATLRKSAIDLRASESEPAPVKEQPLVAAEAAAMGQKAKEVLAEILNLMGISAEVELRVGEKTDETVVEIRAENSGLLIGRKGQTLEALQYLVSRIAGERGGMEGPHIVVDIENYRQRRRKALEDMALRLGEKAKRQRKTVTVDALSAADRRIIHAALQDDPWVTTKSLGQGSYRRLLIIPEGDRRRKEEATAPVQEKPGAKVSK